MMKTKILALMVLILGAISSISAPQSFAQK